MKTTPAMEGLETRRAPTFPSPGTSCSVPAGRPPPRNSLTACAEISGVSSTVSIRARRSGIWSRKPVAITVIFTSSPIRSSSTS